MPARKPRVKRERVTFWCPIGTEGSRAGFVCDSREEAQGYCDDWNSDGSLYEGVPYVPVRLTGTVRVGSGGRKRVGAAVASG